MDAEVPDDATAQFVMSKSAYAVINTSMIQTQARAYGRARPRIEANTRHARGGIRFTCCVPMVDRIIDAIGGALALAERTHDFTLIAELAIARSVALKARDDALHPRHLSMGEQGYRG